MLYQQVSVKTLSGKTIKIMINEDSSVYEMKMMIEMMEGIPPDQMRFICDGRQLEDYKTASYYPSLIKDKVMHLILSMHRMQSLFSNYNYYLN